MIKLAWSIITEPSSLWVRVLRHKYKVPTDYVPVVTSKGNPSIIWVVFIEYGINSLLG